MALISGNVFFHADYLLLTQRQREGGRERGEKEAATTDATVTVDIDGVRFGNRYRQQL